MSAAEPDYVPARQCGRGITDPRIVGNGVCPQQAIAAQVRLLSVCGVAA